MEVRCLSDSLTLDGVLEQIRSEAQTPATVFLLARFRYLLPDGEALYQHKQRHPGLTLQAMTVHASKGLEADYVVLLGVVDGVYGFPSRIEDDPVLSLLLQNEETFPFAEERRLFYVAVTRARRRTFLLTRQSTPSSFLTELRQAHYHGLVGGDIVGHDQHVCPECASGMLVMRTSAYGSFYGCTQYPGCQVLLPRCRKGCKQPMLRRKQSYKCPECKHALEACPQCDTGWLEEKEGQYGKFLGCRNYRKDSASCRFRRKP